MKQSKLLFLLVVLMSMVSNKSFAYDIAVENGNGVTIYYNYINEGKELEVTYKTIKYTKLENGMYREEYKSYQDVENIIIPEEVTYMDRTRKVTSIGDHAFHDSKDLISITIPASVVRIGNVVFQNCTKLNSIQISDLEAWCNINYGTNFFVPHLYLNGEEVKELTIPQGVTSFSVAFKGCRGLTSVMIPSSVTKIDDYAFYNCISLTTVTIPSSVTKIDDYAFYNCISLTTVTIPNSVTTIGVAAFASCKLSSVTIPNSVTSVGKEAFNNNDLSTVVTFINNPFEFDPNTLIFTKNTLYNATLYVPKGTVDKYKATGGWKDFLFIEEGIGPNGDGGESPEAKKCATPTINYQNGTLTFGCETEGATCQYAITNEDIKSGSGNEVQLDVTYHISVYAKKDGYEDSDIVTKEIKLCDNTGDMNGDKKVDAADIVKIVNIIMTSQSK